MEEVCSYVCMSVSVYSCIGVCIYLLTRSLNGFGMLLFLCLLFYAYDENMGGLVFDHIQISHDCYVTWSSCGAQCDVL